MKLLVINGPNMNMLGIREPEIYGSRSYEELKKHIITCCEKNGMDCTVVQSNSEGEIVDIIQEAYGRADGIIINAAAYTHTSIAIPDAIKAVNIKCVEVHLTDTGKREEYRKTDYLADACEACFMGRGFDSYTDAVEYFLK